MPSCFAPGCKSGYNGGKTHTFRAPKHVAANWVRILRKIRADKTFDPLNKGHCLCYLHFEPHLVTKDDVTNVKGDIVTIPRINWKLAESAIPTIFPNLQTHKRMKRLPGDSDRHARSGCATSEKTPRNRRVSAFPNCDSNSSTTDILVPVPAPADLRIWVNEHLDWALQEVDDVCYLYRLRFGAMAQVSQQIVIQNDGSISMYTGASSIIFPEHRSISCKEDLATIIVKLEALKKCKGVTGYENVQVCAGAQKTTEGKWFSEKCKRFGQSDVCNLCKKLFPSLQIPSNDLEILATCKMDPSIKQNKRSRLRRDSN